MKAANNKTTNVVTAARLESLWRECLCFLLCDAICINAAPSKPQVRNVSWAAAIQLCETKMFTNTSKELITCAGCSLKNGKFKIDTSHQDPLSFGFFWLNQLLAGLGSKTNSYSVAGRQTAWRSFMTSCPFPPPISPLVCVRCAYSTYFVASSYGHVDCLCLFLRLQYTWRCRWT